MRWPWGQTPLEKRVSDLDSELHGAIDGTWPTEFLVRGPGAGVTHFDERSSTDRAKGSVEIAVGRLAERHPKEELAALAADMYFSPSVWRGRYVDDGRGRAIDLILRSAVARFPPTDLVPRLQGRLERLLQSPCGHPEETFPRARSHETAPFARPRLEDCLGLLLEVPPSPAVLDLVQGLVAGGFDFANVVAACWHAHERTPERWYELVFELSGAGPVPPTWIAGASGERGRSYEIEAATLSRFFPALMELLFRHGRFDEGLFLASLRHLPRMLNEAARGFAPFGVSAHYGRPLDPNFIALGEAVVDKMAARLLTEMRPGDAVLLKTLEHLRGSRFLLHAASMHRDLGLGKIVYHPPWRYVFDPTTFAGTMTPAETNESLIVHLAGARLEQLDRDARGRLIEELRRFPWDTLAYLLPVSPNARHVLCQALGWEAAIPIVDEILRTGRLQGDIPMWPSEMRSSPDPSYGVIDVPTLRAAIGQAGPELTKRIIKLFRQSGLELSPTLMLVEAVAGWNRTEIEERIRRRNQPAVRAYGALPVVRGEDEILERYLFLKQFSVESKKFGMMRQGNEKSAAKAALENLARNAGYGDSTRLEWAMEARIGGAFAPGKRWVVGEYAVELTVADREIGVVTSKDGHPLKSLPAAVKTDAAYPEIKEALKQLRSQLSRMRASLESILAEGEVLRREEVERLLRLPIAKGIVQAMIWGTEDGRFGVLDADGTNLEGTDGPRFPVPDRLFLAHPYHLFRGGALGAWQKEIVHRRIEQPLKQAFRELYVVTPAEEETRSYSNRFAGRLLNSGVASRLFQARGWKFDPGEVAVPYRVFPKQGLRAVFDFPDAGHILAESESVTSDRIYFEHHPRTGGAWSLEREGLPLAEIPPLVFSEVMRDADLVVSVAQRGEALLSEEAFQRRGEVVKALLDDLGLPGVTIEGHHALVKGKLANYRVHLGTAHIFIDPGNYLCVVPERWGKKHEKLFLPFADEGDAKFSEVISKVLFLVNDDRIREEGILKQIRQGGLAHMPFST